MQSISLNQLNNANDVVARLVSIGNIVIYLLIAFAFIYIIWATVQYFVRGKSGDENRAEASKHIIWGIVGLAIILSIWGMVNLILNTFATNSTVPKDRFPTADFVTGGSGSAAQSNNGLQQPSFENNYNSVTGNGLDNTQNYYH